MPWRPNSCTRCLRACCCGHPCVRSHCRVCRGSGGFGSSRSGLWVDGGRRGRCATGPLAGTDSRGSPGSSSRALRPEARFYRPTRGNTRGGRRSGLRSTISPARVRAEASSGRAQPPGRPVGVRVRRGRAANRRVGRRRRGVAEPGRRSHSRPGRRPRRHRRRHHHGGGLVRARLDGPMARRPEGAAAGRSAPCLAVSRRGRPRCRAVAADARHVAPRDHEERSARGGGGPRRLDRRADGGRSRGRAPRHRRRRGPVERSLLGDRHGHRDRRPRRPGRRCGAAAAGGRHVPRHRDFGRQYRDPRRPDDRRVPAGRSAGTNRDAGVDRPAGRHTDAWSVAAHRSIAPRSWRSCTSPPVPPTSAARR